MTSYRQIEANRRTGPRTDAGKRVARCNAVRHGLMAETVIGALEDAEDYKAFEAAITADYTRNPLWSESSYCDWQAFSGGYAAPRQWKLGYLRFKPQIRATMSKSGRIPTRLFTQPSGRLVP